MNTEQSPEDRSSGTLMCDDFVIKINSLSYTTRIACLGPLFKNLLLLILFLFPAGIFATDKSEGMTVDALIHTLEHDPQRQQLLAQLKALNKHSAKPAHREAALGPFYELVHLPLEASPSPVRLYWQLRGRLAAAEWNQWLLSRGTDSLLRIAAFFSLTLVVWAALAAALRAAIQRLWPPRVLPHTHPSQRAVSRSLIKLYALRLLPSVLAFVVLLAFQGLWGKESLGQTLAIILLIAVLSARLLAALCEIPFAVYPSAHQHTAIRILRAQSRRALILFLTVGFLGKQLDTAPLAQAIGAHLSSLLATICYLSSALIAAWFSLRFRRPVAHLIAHRSLRKRRASPLQSEIFNWLGKRWHFLVWLLVGILLAATLFSIGHAEFIVRRALLTFALIGGVLLLMTWLQRLAILKTPKRRSALPPLYIARFCPFFRAIASVVLGFLLIEAIAQLWGYSWVAWSQHSPWGRTVTTSVFGASTAFFSVWLAWIVLDTALMQKLAPYLEERSGQPKTRAKTILPLIRNVLFIGLSVLGLIAVLANLGVNVTPLLAGAGVIGLAIGFGAQALIQDLITGLFIVLENSLGIGEHVEVEGRSGVVEGLTIRTLRLRDAAGALHAIPFSQIKVIKNDSRGLFSAEFEVKVDSNCCLDTAFQAIEEAGTALMADEQAKRWLVGTVQVLGLERFEGRAMVIKGAFKTSPLRSLDVLRQFNPLLKQSLDRKGILLADA